MSVIPDTSDTTDRPGRALSRVLLKVTLFLALVLGILAALVQLTIDLQQEKDGVQESASAFLDSIVPSAESAVYNFHDAAAEEVIEGLFTQRAISEVRVMNGPEVMAEKVRELENTLPEFAPMSRADTVILERELFNPQDDGTELIGRIFVVVDRSIVPPSIVHRMVSYFLLSTLKNILFGLALVALVYAALARHIIQIADATARWRPGTGAIKPPEPPRFLRGTEVELLGRQVRAMSGAAEHVIHSLETTTREAQKSNSELNERSTQLSEAVKARTEELNAANLALKKQAELDPLTGLFNRGAFDRQAQRLIKDASATGSWVSLMMIDVDQFKPFNDHYGHQAGDDCLKQVASALGALATDDDVIVARYGGEEFVCILRDADRKRGDGFARRIHEAIAALAIPHERSSVSDIVTASIGFAWELCRPGTSLENLVGAADEALYEAKHKGRNRTVRSSDNIRERVKERRDAVSNLLQAVETRQFEPFFQSIVDARTNEIVGMEALARWRRADDDILRPDAFMSVAKANDLVRLIDGIIFDKSAQFLRDAQNAGIHVPALSINLSDDCLADENLIERLRAFRAGIETPVALELIETRALDMPSDQLNWTIDAIRDLGLDIEIDDFGTGSTSINSLLTLRPARLKIARHRKVTGTSSCCHVFWKSAKLSG